MNNRFIILFLLFFSFVAKGQNEWTALDKYYFSIKCFEQNQIDLGIDYLQQAAQEGLDSAQYNLGLIYETYEMPDSAFQLMKRASITHDDALMRLAHYYRVGFGCTVNTQRSFEIIQQLANRNHGEALYTMSACYYQGEFVPKSKEQGIIYWHRSADAGWLDAQIALARNYYLGGEADWGIKQDKAKAYYYASMAAKQDNPKGKSFMGDYCAEEGKYDDAVKWWKLASDEGEPYAQYKYAKAILTGNGDSKDIQQAVSLLQYAAENNVIDAVQMLGSMYFNGVGVTKDTSKGLKLLEQAANNGNVTAQSLLGDYYLKGREVPQDLELGTYWLEKAIEGGDGDAANTLGLLYTKSDVVKAVKYFQKGHELGFIVSTYNLGRAYYTGEGVTKDYNKAYDLLKKAADVDFFGAQSFLARMYATGEGRKIDFSQAVKWAHKTINNEAAKQYESYQSEFYTCYSILDYCYRNGLGVTKSIKKANQYKAQADKFKKYASSEIDWEKIITTFDEQKNQEWVDEYNKQITQPLENAE